MVMMMGMMLMMFVTMLLEEAGGLHPFPSLLLLPIAGLANTLVTRITIICTIVAIIMTLKIIPPGEKIRKHLKGELYRGELLFEAGQSLLHYVLPVNNIYLAWKIFVLPGQQYMSCLDVIFN